MATNYSFYRVKSGDTLSKIARQEMGAASRWPELAKANGLKPPHLILVGMPLRIPRASAAVSNMPHIPSHRPPDPIQAMLRASRPHLPMTPARAPSLGAPPGVAPPGGDTPANKTSYPTLIFPIKHEVYFGTPAGQVKIAIEGSITIQRGGFFEWELSKEGLQGKAAGGGMSAAVDGQPFKASDPTSAKIKAEYTGKLASIFASTQFRYNPVTQASELTFSPGWKFGNGSYSFKPPGTHVFTFGSQPVKAEGLEGSLSVVVELTQMTPAMIPTALPLPIPRFEFEWPTFRARDLKPTPAQTTTFATALMIILAIVLLPVGA